MKNWQILGGVLFLVGFSASSTLSPNLRTVPASVAEALCNGQFDLKTFWDAKVFDVQIEGALLRQSNPLILSALQTRAVELAEKQGYLGYSAGLCSKTSGWILAFPARTPLLVDGYKIQMSEFGGCTEAIKVFWASDQSGRSRELLGKAGQFSIPKVEAGFFGIECGPVNGVGIAREFYLGSSRHHSYTPPLLENIGGGSHSAKLHKWINKVRAREGLMAVSLALDLSEAAKDLAVNQNVQHDSEALESWRKKLSQKKINLIGEDRVTGSSLEEAIFLLWASPRHRDLLLHPTVTLIGIEAAPTQRGGVFMSILGASK